MSDIGLSYDAKVQPPQVGAQFGLSFSDTTLKATVRSVDNFVVTLSPSGNVSEQILSGVAWPLAQFLGAVLPSMGKALITGYSFDVITILPSTQTVEGEQVTVQPGNLSLSNYNDMLMVRGSVSIT
jgi:hypothetical protein